MGVCSFYRWTIYMLIEFIVADIDVDWKPECVGLFCDVYISGHFYRRRRIPDRFLLDVTLMFIFIQI